MKTLPPRSRLKRAACYLVLSVAAVVLGLIVWDMSAAQRGWLSATIDVKLGRYEIVTYGRPSRGFSDYTRVMQDHYQVLVRPIAGCAVTHSLAEYASAYNAVSIQAINQKYGRDVVRSEWR